MKSINKIYWLVGVVFLFDLGLLVVISTYKKETPVKPVLVQQEPENKPIKKVLANGKRSDRVPPHQHVKIKFKNVNDGNIARHKEKLD